MRMTQVSSGRIATHTLTWVAAAGPREYIAVCAPAIGTRMPSASPPPAAAEPITKRRRERLVFSMASPSGLRRGLAAGACVLGRAMHRGADALVGAAAADVGHRGIDVGVA